MVAIRETVLGLRGEGHWWALLTVAWGWLFFNGFRVVLPALLPEIKSEFAISNASAGFAMTILWTMYAGLQFPGGVLADRFGERKLLILGTVLGMISIFSFYVAPLFVLFVAICGLFGVGAGLFGTPRDMFLAKTFRQSDTAAYGVTFAAGSIGSAGLPFVATVIANRFGWRVAVVSLLPALVLLGIGLWRVVPGTTTDEAEMAKLTTRETINRTIHVLTTRPVLLPGCGMVFFLFTFQALITFLPTYLIEIKGLDQRFTAMLFGLLFVFGALIQSASGRFSDRFHDRTVVLGLAILSTATLVVLPITSGRTALALLVPVLGIRIAIVPFSTAYIVRELPEAIKGTGWGLLRTIFFGIGATGSSVLGLFADAGLFDAGLLFLAALTAGIFVVWWFLPPDDVANT